MGGKASLILVLGFAFIFGYVGIRINELESRTVDNAARYLEVTTSHNLAVAGANIGLAKLYQDTSLWKRNSDTMLTQQSFAAGSLSVLYDYITSVESRLVSTSELSSYGHTFRDTVIVQLKVTGRYEILGLLVGFSGNDDTWITRDSMWGRVHFNGRVNVKGSPVYHDKITVSKGFDPPVGVGTNQAIFLNGYETGMAQVPLPGVSDTVDTFPFADTVLIGNWSLLFLNPTPANNDGVIQGRDALHDFTGPKFVIPTLLYDVILVQGDVSIKGVVDGRVNIGATGKIYIDDDITYAVDPLADPNNPANDDMLGLVSIGDIVLYNPTPTYLGSKRVWNVYSVATTLAGQIKADQKPSANTYGAYVLKNYGGLVARDRFDIAQYSSSQSPPYPFLNGGFYRWFRWDNRLGPPLDMRPPHYPEPDDITVRLRITNWWENVSIPQ